MKELEIVQNSSQLPQKRLVLGKLLTIVVLESANILLTWV